MLKIDDENNVYLTRGDTAIFDVILTTDDGDPYTMTSNDELIFTIRRIAGKGEEVVKKTVTAPEISLDTDDTKDLTFGPYKYDVYIHNILTDEIDTFIANKEFYIGEEVHDFEQD